MLLVEIKNIFVEKNTFRLIFMFCHQFFPLLEDTSFKHVAKRIEFAKTNQKRTQNKRALNVLQ